MNFQTSCMILVRDEQQQIELQKWMNGISWRIRGGRDSKHCFLVADTDQNAALWMELDESAREWFGHDFYDCGENIEMFKALAAMNSDNDRRAMVRRSRRHPLRKAEKYHTDQNRGAADYGR